MKYFLNSLVTYKKWKIETVESFDHGQVVCANKRIFSVNGKLYELKRNTGIEYYIKNRTRKYRNYEFTAYQIKRTKQQVRGLVLTDDTVFKVDQYKVKELNLTKKQIIKLRLETEIPELKSIINFPGDN